MIDLMQLLGWLALCVLVTLILRRHPVALIATAIALRIAIPSVAASVFTGETTVVQLQPASYFIICAVVFTFLARPRSYGREIATHALFYVAVLLVFAFAVVVTLSLRGNQSVALLTDTLGMGLGLFLMIRVALSDSPQAGRRLALAFVGIAVAESLIALTQWVVGDTIFWKSYMADFYWYSPTGTTVTGTVGAFLDVGMLLALAVPLTANIRGVFLRFGTAIVLILGILATERRTPLIIAVIGLGYLLVVSRMPPLARILAFVGVGGASVFLLSSDLVAGVSSRFANDVVSADVRSEALEYFLANIGGRPWYGGGFGSNGAVVGLDSSFENGYTMYAWDIGVLATVILFSALLIQLVLALVRRAVVPGAIAAFGSVLVLIWTYSGLETLGPAAWLLFFAAGICSSRSRGQLEETDVEIDPADAGVVRARPPSTRAGIGSPARFPYERDSPMKLATPAPFGIRSSNPNQTGLFGSRM